MSTWEKIKKMPITWIFVVFFGLLYVSLVFNHNVVCDEAFTMNLLRNNVREIIQGTANDVHPPLYYLIAKVVYFLFGEKLIWQKLLAIVFMIATLCLGPTVVKRIFGKETGFFFVLFAACIPCTMLFAVQVRMYTMSLFFVTGAGLYAYEAYFEEKKKSFILYLIFGLCAAYCHYFALVAIAIIHLLLLLGVVFSKKNRVKKWWIASGVFFLGYLPWCFVLLNQFKNVTNDYWIPEISGETILGYFTWTFGLEKASWTTAVFLAIFVYMGISFVGILRKEKNEKDFCALAMALIPVLVCATGLIVSKIFRPIYRDQYVLPSLGLFCVAVAVMAKNTKKVFATLLVCWLLFVGAIQYKEEWFREYRSSLIDKTEKYFADTLEDGDCIIYNAEIWGFIYRYYLPDYEVVYIDDWNPQNDFERTFFLNVPNEKQITEEQLDEWGYVMYGCGYYGIEQQDFEIYVLYKKDLNS